MSASKEKKARVELRSEGNDKKRNAASDEALKAKKFRRNAIIAVVCIVLVVAAAIVINSNLFYTGFTAVRVGNTDYSAAEVDVFFRNTFNNIYSSWGDLAGYIVDTSTPLDEQEYGDQTWADYIYDQALENMRQITALYDAAMSDGYTLTDADEALIDEQLAIMDYQAAVNGASNTNQFLAAYYGKGVSTKVLKSVLTKMVIAQSYSDQINESFSYTQAELDSYYAGHRDELDFIDYYYYLVDAGDDAAAAHASAEAIIDGVGDADGFTAGVAAYSADAAPGELYLQGSDLTASYSEYSAWLLDGARRPGDTTVIDTDSGSYALLFAEREDNDYTLRSMRHILINTPADDNYEYTDEAKEETRAKIEEIEADWQALPTEENFAALANEYSEDTGSNTNGGLYENIRKKYMVTNINNFLFHETHQPGDTAIVYGESGAYQGWHLVYYVGEGEIYRKELAEDALRNGDYTAYIDNLTADYTVSTGSGLRYAKLK